MNFDTASINEKIYQLLRERIIFGEYAPGSRIEIKNLSQESGTSTQPQLLWTILIIDGDSYGK